MSGPLGSSQWMYASGAEAESQSLRFNDDDTAYLSWTPASAGNRKTWTLSFWVKPSVASGDKALFSASTTVGSNSNRTLIQISESGDDHKFFIGEDYSGTFSYRRKLSRVFRDPSSWYHIVIEVDTTLSNGADRVKVYVNGNHETDYSGTDPTQNADWFWNNTISHAIGRDNGNQSRYFDGYLSEVNFVDGTALDATSFGETDDNGQWVPIIAPDVTYGTNGFYLPFTNDYSVKGFNSALWIGNGSLPRSITGIGFEPDFVWMKNRSATYYHQTYDSVRGTGTGGGVLYTNRNDAVDDTYKLSSFDSDGVTLSTSLTNVNNSGNGIVGWFWDMGTGSAVSNTDGSITSSVKASTTYGQSIVKYTGNDTAGDTVGHGLSSAPEFILVKRLSTGGTSLSNWTTFHTGTSATPQNDYMFFNTSGAKASASTVWNNTAPTSSVFTLSTSDNVNASTDEYIAYCFHSVAGYSDFGSYTGTGVAGNTVTTGFKPAFVMIKRTDSSGNWYIYDNMRGNNRLQADQSDADYLQENVDFLDDGFELTSTASGFNSSGASYIYMAFYDGREAAFWLDQSGNNNDWTNNNMQESDISLDSPTNNFSTMNPLASSATLSEGNLRSQYSGSGTYQSAASTMSISSGKWYVELRTTIDSSYVYYPGFGIADITTAAASNPTSSDYLGNSNNGIAYYTNNGFFTNNAIDQSSTVTVSSGDIIGIAIDLDSSQNTFKIYQNGSLAETYNIDAPANAYAFCESTYFAASAARADWNFGQDSSFHGLEVAQGNQDANGKGDFYYTPPAGHLALCTDNLSDPAITDGSEHFNTVLYTGNGSTNNITGVGFQPDFVWTKPRSFADYHQAFDSVRGTGKNLSINQAVAEQTQSGSLSSFDSDGFTIGSWSNLNSSGSSFVAWNWKADNTSGASNTDGSITSTVSANTTAGFSIVSYTGDGNSSATIGHGLNAAPEMMIFKGRTFTSNWTVYHVGMGNDGGMQLNQTAAEAVNSQYWNNTTPTSSVFTIGLYENTSAEDFICYAFHSVEGYSKLGSYTGNGSSDGPFVYTGFRPAWVMVKATGTGSSWFIWDVERNTYNAATTPLFANSSSAEEATLYPIDFLSNGFKLRASSGYGTNESAAYIYMAFAEVPFKYSNAR